MRLAARLRSLGRGVVHRSRMDDELDEELRAYFEELVARHERAGLARDDAREAALREMGGVQEVKSAVALSAVRACWWPARRAISADVLDILRAE